MAGPLRTTARRSAKSRALPALVLAVGLILSVAIWLFVRSEVRRQDAVRFERLKERMLDGIEARFQAARQALYGGRAFVESTGDVSQSEWAGYVSSVWQFFDRGVVGLGYVQR